MIRRYLHKRLKIARGVFRTYLQRRNRPYDAGNWWDREFFGSQMSDAATISPIATNYASAYHYSSVETLILRELWRRQVRVETVADLGAGAGHWVSFYQGIGATRVRAIDVSEKSASHLRATFGSDVDVRHGRACDHLADMQADIVNAIGVMFHIVDDREWADTVQAIGSALKPGGLIVVGGHFGWLNGVNVQHGNDGTVNKRLRSARRWRQTLTRAGFANIRILRNNAYLHASSSLPEANLLVAEKQ